MKVAHIRRRIATALLTACFVPSPAGAVIVTQPYPIVPNTTASASQVQADFSTIYSAFNGNIDASNLASGSGIYASQILPDNAGHATFGGSLEYTFQGDLSVLGNSVTAGVTQSDRFVATAPDGASMLTFDSNNGSNETSIGENTTAGYPYFSVAKLDTLGSFQSWLIGIDSSFNVNFPNGNIVTPKTVVSGSSGMNAMNAYSSSCGTLGFFSSAGTPVAGISPSAQGFYCNGSSTDLINIDSSGSFGVLHNIAAAGNLQGKYGSGTTYTIPFDANSVSGSNNTHYEHNSATTGSFSGGFACTGTLSYGHVFTSNPDLFYTLLGFSGTAPITLYTNTRSTSTFQTCAFLSGASSGTVTFSWLAVGE